MCLSHRKTLKDSFEHKGNPQGLSRENGGRNGNLTPAKAKLKKYLYVTFLSLKISNLTYLCYKKQFSKNGTFWYFEVLRWHQVAPL
jgi:hypothetical protein